MKVLIPTGGLGGRVGDFTKYNSKSLLKIGDKTAISHIIEYYPEADFVITLGHFGDYVKQYLLIAHPEVNFEFIEAYPYEGPDSSVLKSISFAKEALQCPFIFHVSDTLISYESTDTNAGNWMVCGESSQTDRFRTVVVQDGAIIKINEKGELVYDFAYAGVAGIKDYKEFWEATDEILAEGNFVELSDCHVLSKIMKTVRVEPVMSNSWSDTGNAQNLAKTKEAYKPIYTVLDKNEESIYFVNNSVIKFFSNEDICANRVVRAKALQPYVPEIVASSKNFYRYELVRGDLLARVATPKKLIELIDWAETNLWIPVVTEDFNVSCKDFYFYKTRERVKKYLEITGTKDITEKINGETIPSYLEMEELIDWESIYNTDPVMFHGDFVLDNILTTEEGFTLLDWRQDFGGLIEAGDKYYDLAKLNHNLILNHHIIDNDGFTIKTFEDGSKRCDVLQSHNLVVCQQTLLADLEKRGYDIKKIETLMALIWINMSPLHVYPFNKFLFYFGKYKLWKTLQ